MCFLPYTALCRRSAFSSPHSSLQSSKAELHKHYYTAPVNGLIKCCWYQLFISHQGGNLSHGLLSQQNKGSHRGNATLNNNMLSRGTQVPSHQVIHRQGSRVQHKENSREIHLSCPGDSKATWWKIPSCPVAEKALGRAHTSPGLGLQHTLVTQSLHSKNGINSMLSSLKKLKSSDLNSASIYTTFDAC